VIVKSVVKHIIQRHSGFSKAHFYADLILKKNPSCDIQQNQKREEKQGSKERSFVGQLL